MKKLSGASSYKKWAEWKAGDYFKGKLNSVSLDQYKKNNYSMKVIETKFKDGKNLKAGEFLCLNSNGMLDKAMANVNEGDTVIIVYKGTSVIAKGPFAGKDSHSMDVFLDDTASNSENKITDEEADSDDLLG